MKTEWKHLDKDGRTCERCAHSKEKVPRAVEELDGEFRPRGWTVTLKGTLLTKKGFIESNQVLLNGKPLEKILPQAAKSEICCSSCKNLPGLRTLCQTIWHQGKTYEAIPPDLIPEAA
nr:DUF2703 domain-containing protein [Dethiosulfatarculus sandiegensis]